MNTMASDPGTPEDEYVSLTHKGHQMGYRQLQAENTDLRVQLAGERQAHADTLTGLNKLRQMLGSAAERIASQSDQLSRRAERVNVDEPISIEWLTARGLVVEFRNEDHGMVKLSARTPNDPDLFVAFAEVIFRLAGPKRSTASASVAVVGRAGVFRSDTGRLMSRSLFAALCREFGIPLTEEA